MALSLFSTPEITAVFAPEAWLGRMLVFEAALARAEAAAGVIPQEAADAIAAVCRMDLFDVPAILRETEVTATPMIPLARLLGERADGEAGRFVHWGATSQDAIDTAMMLQVRDGLDLLLQGLLDAAAACADLAERHRRTLMLGRTLLQHALPITFGLKAARWLAMLTRRVVTLRVLRASALVVQFGGAAGTLAALGSAETGLRVTELLAQDLGLAVPDLPWHAERDRVGEIAAALGVVAGALAKIAGDLLLLSQSDVGEVSEGAAPGKGGSSAMPQKQNPVDITLAVSATRLALGQVPVVLAGMVQEHERSAGNWQAEWAALPDLFCYTAAAVEHVRRALVMLMVDEARMRANLIATNGQVMAEALSMALAPKLGRPAAQRLVQAASRRATETNTDLRGAALQEEGIRAALPAAEIDTALDPANYLGSADAFIQRALDEYSRVRR